MMSTSQNTYGLPYNKFGLVDKQKEVVGLQEKNLETSDPSVTEKDNLLMFDTRDCIGRLSLREAQIAFSYEAVLNGKLTPSEFKRSLNSDGVVVTSKLVNIVSESKIPGFPQIRENSPYIEGNNILITLPKKLKLLKSFEIINAIIPRDIIPMYVYFPGFINNCIPFEFRETGIGYLKPTNKVASSIWESPIPETYDDFFDKNIDGIDSNKLGGVYYTPLRYWRSYTGPNCMSNPHTPPPYQLWNPPQDNFSDDPWPFQPQPIRGQRIPTYRAKNGVVFSGYGLYDLEDFPAVQEYQVADGTMIQIPLRKLILKLLVPEGQYVNGVSAESLIDNSAVDDFNDKGIVDNPLTQTGYGDYQRFIPGPGLGMNYQPNQYRNSKSAPIDLSVSTYDHDTGSYGPMPVPFPNFRGNVWGPYGRPGDRFQNRGLQSTVDELYLNGDLSNLEGNPTIWAGYDPSVEPYKFEYYMLTIKRSNNVVRFQTVESASNPNIRNAMRVEYDGGFGAVYAYTGKNTVNIGYPGPLVTGGLPNTQYDGRVHKFNHDVWMTPRSSNPKNWVDTLSGPQKPTIVADSTFPGWIYIWRNIFPWIGSIYVPITAGGVGPMEYLDQTTWMLDDSNSLGTNLTLGSSQWSSNPVIGMANDWRIPSTNILDSNYVSNNNYGSVLGLTNIYTGIEYEVSQYSNVEYTSLSGIAYPNIDARFSVNVTSVTVDDGSILTYSISSITNDMSYNMYAAFPPTDPERYNLCYFIFDYAEQTFKMYEYAGYNYNVEFNISTVTIVGSGTGMKVDIREVEPANKGIVRLELNTLGTGYQEGDMVMIDQGSSNRNAIYYIDTLKWTDFTMSPVSGGSFYSVDNGVTLTNITGSGSGKTVNITSVDSLGSITGISVASVGTGYVGGNYVRVDNSTPGAIPAVYRIIGATVISVTPGGYGYTVANGVTAMKYNPSTSGEPFTVNITSVGTVGNITGISVATSANSYNVGDYIVIDQGGNVTALYLVTSSNLNFNMSPVIGGRNFVGGAYDIFRRNGTSFNFQTDKKCIPVTFTPLGGIGNFEMTNNYENYPIFTTEYCYKDSLSVCNSITANTTRSGKYFNIVFDFVSRTYKTYEYIGVGYTIGDRVQTVNLTGTGNGLILNILSVDPEFGGISEYSVYDSGSGYNVGDIIKITQAGSSNNAIIRVNEVSINQSVIPNDNQFHYLDPKANGPSNLGTNAILSIDYVNGTDICTNECSQASDNCNPPLGEYTFNVGQKVIGSSSSGDDPRPNPVPTNMLKCDFISITSPEKEWDDDPDKNGRPLDNKRLRQTRNYINERVAYHDLGSNNGMLISYLINYRTFFVSSTPDTDIVIRIEEAERSIYTQSLNNIVNQSNFYIPIRLNLGTTSGTLEYVEAVQGTLTSSGVYWKKEYYPPKAEMNQLHFSIWTYEGTPIPLERCLGLNEQFSSQAVLFSSSIASSLTVHGEYLSYAPNLPPFSSVYSTTPSSVLITGNNNSKSLEDPFDPYLIKYAQRNLGLMFKIVTYQAGNPGITEIMKRMPFADNVKETFEDDDGVIHEFIPLASNIDQYDS